MVKVKPGAKVITIETALQLQYSCDFPHGNSCDYGPTIASAHFPAAIVQAMLSASDGLWLQKIIVKAGGKVITIEPSADALSVKEVDELVLERFRIIFQAVKDYGSLLGGLREVGGN